MWTVSAVGSQRAVRAAADALDALDPSPADAVSWFEDAPARFRLLAYVGAKKAAEALARQISALSPGLQPLVERVPEEDWVAMVLGGLPAVRAGRFLVAGAHALAQGRPARTPIWIEASEAFGTGHHGTTRGCLLEYDALLRRGLRPQRVLDVGAGSGVLAIAAALSGARADAVEIDARAVAILRENLRNNRVERQVRATCGDAGRFAAARAKRYDLIFANVLLRPLRDMALPLSRALAPGGLLITSGILHQQERSLRQAYQARGLVLARRLRLEGWSTCVFAARR